LPETDIIRCKHIYFLAQKLNFNPIVRVDFHSIALIGEHVHPLLAAASHGPNEIRVETVDSTCSICLSLLAQKITLNLHVITRLFS